VPAREIIHEVKCPLFHPLVGVSPIYAAGWPAMAGLNIRNKSDKFFANGSRPGGVLTAPGPISDANALELKTYWETNFSGDNIGKIAVLGDGLKYEAMAVTAEQARLVEQLHMSDEDIAKCFHMPRHKVGVGPDPTYNNIEALTKTYYSDCLQVHIESLEAKLDTGLEVVNVPGRTLGIELDRGALFEMDTNSRADAATKAITAGMSPNEVRFRFYDLGPTKGGESPMIQQQNFSLEALAERDANKPFAKPEPAPTPAALPPGDEPPEPEDATKGITVGLILTKLATFRQAAL
jgi:HK97 family phage portal protein